jgi:Tfp pilus assembly protein PilN
MLAHLCSRNSAITFDVGTAGIRAFQVGARSRLALGLGACSRFAFGRGGRGSHLASRDLLQLELSPARPQDDQEPPAPDYSRLARLVGQANFTGNQIGLVLSPPDAHFCALRLPKKALAQPEERIRQALVWEVAREMRADASELEVRHWLLPPGHHQGLNVMAVALPIERALGWHQLFARDRLCLRRIAVSPCALVHLACRMQTPAENELWGILDLGFRRSTLTVVIGHVPAYIRSLSASADVWTRRLAQGFEVALPAAEQIKRAHGMRSAERGFRPSQADQPLLDAHDTPSVVFALLREPVDHLIHQINRCFNYVLQNFSDLNATRLLLAGGGANLRGLADYLQAQLDVSVALLASEVPASAAASAPDAATHPVPWERPVPDTTIRPETAAAIGAALLDADSRLSRSLALPPTKAPVTYALDLLPESCHSTRRRLARRNAWSVVLTFAGLLLAGAWLVLRVSDHVIDRSNRELAAIQIRQSELDRQLTLATMARNDLAERARVLSTLRQEQLLPQQLLTLSQQLPDGVVFTEIAAEPALRPGRFSPYRPAAPPANAPETTANDPSPQPVPLLVRLRGYAVEHNDLTRLIDVLQRVPRWEHVELLRAAREPYGDGEALAFQLECLPLEGLP